MLSLIFTLHFFILYSETLIIFRSPQWACGQMGYTFSHNNVGLILTKMRENVALCYGFSHFRQVKSLPKIPAMFGWRPISEVRKLARFFSTRATRWLYLSSRPMLMMNSSLSTPITIFPDGLFIYKEPAAKLCGIYHYNALKLRTNTKVLQKHS